MSQIKILFRGDTARDLGVAERLLSGSIAGAISQTVIYPMEVILQKNLHLCLSTYIWHAHVEIVYPSGVFFMCDRACAQLFWAFMA